MPVTVTYLGDGDVGGAVVYGIPFVVGEVVTLPDDFEFTDKIVNNGTFEVLTACGMTVREVAEIVVTPATVAPTVVIPKPRRGRPPRAG
jgi:hypothetical protein